MSDSIIVCILGFLIGLDFSREVGLLLLHPSEVHVSRGPCIHSETEIRRRGPDCVLELSVSKIPVSLKEQ